MRAIVAVVLLAVVGTSVSAQEPEALRLRQLVREDRREEALAALPALLAAHPGDPVVRTTAAMVRLATADLPGARRDLNLALATPGVEAEAWLTDATLRLLERDPEGAVASYREALRRDPKARGSSRAVAVADRLMLASRDPSLGIEAALAQAERREAEGRSGAGPRSTARMLKSAEARTLLAVDAPDRAVTVPMVPCWEGSPYSCIVLRAGGGEYMTLLDTGNQPGVTLHEPALIEALDTVRGAAMSTSTGSVDTAMASHEVLARALDFIAFRVTDVPATFFPKPRPHYFDANLNPCVIQDRVVTLDYPRDALTLRTAEAFRAHVDSLPLDRVARLPLYGSAWCHTPVEANGRSALAMVETGAEDLALGEGWARRNGVAVRDTTIVWRGRDFSMKMTTATLVLGPISMGPRDAVVIGPGDIVDPVTRLTPSAVIGPVALEDLEVSFDPFRGELVVYDPPARSAAGPHPRP